jgi:hypothetical protein
MSVIELIYKKINKRPSGDIFTYLDFIDLSVKYNYTAEALIKALNRLAQTGKLRKLSKGKFYKPETTPFGEIMPRQYEIVKDLLFRNGKMIAYLTGYSIYNQLGLTEQISSTIQIGAKNNKPKIQRGIYSISFTLQKNNINENNFHLLQLLDCIKFIKTIPDTTPKDALKQIKVLLKKLDQESINKTFKLSLAYSPYVRALLGGLLGDIKPELDTSLLLNSLNQLSIYKFEGLNTIISNVNKWHIK